MKARVALLFSATLAALVFLAPPAQAQSAGCNLLYQADPAGGGQVAPSPEASGCAGAAPAIGAATALLVTGAMAFILTVHSYRQGAPSSGGTSSSASGTARAVETANYRDNCGEWISGPNGLTRVTAVVRTTYKGGPRPSGERTAQRKARERGGPGYQGGHGAAYRWFRGMGEKNTWAQVAEFNNGAYRRLEDEWAAWTSRDLIVWLRVTLFPLGGAVPESVMVEYQVVNPSTGDVEYQTARWFANESSASFTRQLDSKIKSWPLRAEAPPGEEPFSWFRRRS